MANNRNQASAHRLITTAIASPLASAYTASITCGGAWQHRQPQSWSAELSRGCSS